MNSAVRIHDNSNHTHCRFSRAHGADKLVFSTMTSGAYGSNNRVTDSSGMLFFVGRQAFITKTSSTSAKYHSKNFIYLIKRKVQVY